MAHKNSTDQEPSNHLEVKAKLLAKLLEKHNPKTIQNLAMQEMRKVDSNSDAHKVFAASYELFQLFK